MVSKLKIARTQKGLIQIDLWIKSGIPQWRLSLIERGIPPTKKEACKISEVLNVPVEELFENVKPEKMKPIRR